MKDFLTFRKMITPVIIQIVFWVGSVISVIVGVVVIFIGLYSATQGSKDTAAASIISGLLTAILGPLFLRIYAELTILFFRIYDQLVEINKK